MNIFSEVQLLELLCISCDSVVSVLQTSQMHDSCATFFHNNLNASEYRAWSGDSELGVVQKPEAHSDEVVAAGKAAKSHGISMAEMAPRTRHQLLPMQCQHLLLQKATAVLESSTGDVNCAFGLLRCAIEHSDARGDVDTKARCHLELSRIESLAGEVENSVVLAQSAQQLTKDTHIWLQAVIQYSRQRYVPGAARTTAIECVSYSNLNLNGIQLPRGSHAVAISPLCESAFALPSLQAAYASHSDT